MQGMDNTQAILVYITTENPQQAMTIATALVEQKLAACGNILPAIQSVFYWDNAVQHSEESLLLLKSTPDRFEQLCAVVRALHSYTTPCITALPIVAGNPDFMQWIQETTHN